MQYMVPLCFYPTTVIFIDDKASYLTQLKTALETLVPTMHMKFYHSTQEALSWINDKSNNSTFIKSISETGYERGDYITTEIDLRKLHQYSHKTTRFNEISIVIADYAMPSMTGLELLNDIDRSSIMRILLTGEAGYELAVQAFNDKLINQFLMKDMADLDEKLLEVINQHATEYFINFSKLILDSEDYQADKIKNILKDKDFITLFNEIKKDNDIVEYYILNAQCDYLLIDRNGNQSVLAIKSEQAMRTYTEMLNDVKEQADDSLLQKLQRRSHIPFFYTDDDLDSLPQDWDDYIHPAKKLQMKKNTLYWSLIKNITDEYDFEALDSSWSDSH